MTATRTRNDPSVPEVKKPLTREEKEFMLAHILRLPDVFLAARANLLPSHFVEADRIYGVLWKAAISVAGEYQGELPPEGAQIRIEIAIRRIIDENPRALSDSEQEELLGRPAADGTTALGVLAWMYESLAPSDLIPADGNALLREFLTERMVVKPLKEYIVGLGADKPANLPQMLELLENRRGQVAAIGGAAVRPGMPSVYRPEATPDVFTTNVSFIDECMNGGQTPGDVNTILGPTGGGKTMLGLKLAYDCAVWEKQQAARNGTEPGHWYFLTYEQSVESGIQPRLISYAAQIHADSLYRDKYLSTPGNLKSYELTKYADLIERGEQILSEQERFDNAAALMTPPNFWLVDMSGNDPTNPRAGEGGIEEIAQLMLAERRAGRVVRGVVIDYAGLVVNRFMNSRGADLSLKRHYLAEFVDKARRLVAERHKAVVWVLHQLRGAVTGRDPSAKQHHSDAAECKTFADNASFAFDIGTKDEATSTVKFACTKRRRSGSDDKTRLVFIDGAFGNMTSADGLYTLDVRQRRIVPRSVSAQIVSGPAVEAAAASVKASKSTTKNPAEAAVFADNRPFDQGPELDELNISQAPVSEEKS